MNNETSEKHAFAYAVNTYLKDTCPKDSHVIDLDPGWTVGNKLNNGLFRNDNLHKTQNGYEKLSRLFIDNIMSLKTSKQQYPKSTLSKSYRETVSFSMTDDQFPPLLAVNTPLKPKHNHFTSLNNTKSI